MKALLFPHHTQQQLQGDLDFADLHFVDSKCWQWCWCVWCCAVSRIAEPPAKMVVVAYLLFFLYHAIEIEIETEE